MAQLGLLNRCSRCLPRISRRGGSLLTAAKVLALSRVLNKSISQSDEAPPVLEPIREQLSLERERLLARIDMHLTRPESDFQHLVDAVCAFCITTSSSSTDGIRHLQDLRLREIKQSLDSSEKRPENFISAFQYYLSSLQMIRKLLGRPLSDTFRELKSQPVLQASDVSTLSDLALESVQSFLPREVLNFVPFLKHQDANQKQLLSALSEWSKISFQDLTTGLVQALADLRKPAEVLEFREKVMGIWLPTSASASVHSKDEIFARLRAMLNDRVQDVIRDEIKSLEAVAEKIGRATQRSSSSDQVSLKLWDEELLRAPLGNGCVSFKTGLMDRHLGQSSTSHRITSSMQRWIHKTSDTAERIQILRKRRWIDVIEEDDADDGNAPSIERTLQTEDPDIFSSAQSSALNTTLDSFQTSLQALTISLSPSSPIQSVIFLLRTLRTVHHILSISPQTQPLKLDTLLSLPKHLHGLLAKHISRALPKPQLPKSSASQAHLWTGTPLLPTLPSLHVYKFLQALTRAMEEAGTDLWCLEAVAEVKRNVAGNFGGLSSSMTVGSRAVANGVETEKDGAEKGEDKDRDIDQIEVIQGVFDGLYLLEALGNRFDGEEETDGKGLIALMGKAKTELKETDGNKPDEIVQILEQRAKAYWTRTSLLFGLLA